MKRNFELLCEALTQIKTTKILRYPKQINLSKEFLESLEKEVKRHLVIDESTELPIQNLNEKMLKAINFHIIDIREHCGHCGKKKHVRVIKRKKGPIVQSQSGAGTGYGTSKVTGGL